MGVLGWGTGDGGEGQVERRENVGDFYRSYLRRSFFAAGPPPQLAHARTHHDPIDNSKLDTMLKGVHVMIAAALLAVVTKLALVTEAANSGSPWNGNDGYSCSGDTVNCYNQWHYNSCPSACNNGNGCRECVGLG